MGTKWDELFGKKYYIEIKNEERPYLGLEPVQEEWDTTQFYSKTNLWHKRTTIFWEENVIKKLIVEEKKLTSADDQIIYHSIQEHDTNKYETGDIFRVEIDRFHYCYGLITGQVCRIQKWKELPEHHSLQSVMMVPIMIRYYDVETTNPNLSAEELEQYPLGRVSICGDNDIIWGTHTIVGHKALDEDDLEFNLVCYRIKDLNSNICVHTYDGFVSDGMVEYPESFDLYVEWGTAATVLPFEKISKKLQKYLKNYRSAHGGVAIGIHPERMKKSSFEYKGNLLNDINKEMRMELFLCLGLDSDATFDEFAGMFGGLTKKEILTKEL